MALQQELKHQIQFLEEQVERLQQTGEQREKEMQRLRAVVRDLLDAEARPADSGGCE